MSFKVMIIPEDPTYNGAILQPLVERMLRECGRQRATIQVLANPKVQGFQHARAMLPEIMDRYRHFGSAQEFVERAGIAEVGLNSQFADG